MNEVLNEEKKIKALKTFYTGIIYEDNKIDVYSYMVCYSYIKRLSSDDKVIHAKALLGARMQVEEKFIGDKKLRKE